MDNRLTELTKWLKESLSIQFDSINAASEDASFRRYFRITGDALKVTADNSLIVMDAPPSQESLHEFLSISQLLVSHNVHAPKIHAFDLKQGFVLLEDLGDRPYLNELHSDSKILYNDAIDALVAIQSINKKSVGEHPLFKDQKNTQQIAQFTPPAYDKNLIDQELELFIDWYCKQHLEVNLTDQEYSTWQDLKLNLVEVFKQQPQVWVHRDFHSRNLMITDDSSPGVIDFQDMVWGPISYDLASLFKDCYIEWPRDTQLQWLQIYLDKLAISHPEIIVSFDQLIEWYDLTGLQRHLKVLGIFCRLNYRDDKSQYLLDLALVEKYVKEVLALYPQFNAFKLFFNSLTDNA